MNYILFFLCFFSACTKASYHPKASIGARIYPYSRKDLPSSRLDTPDPIKATLLPSEMLVIDWKIDSLADISPLQAEIRFSNGDEKKMTIPIHSLKGRTILEFESDDLGNRKKIISYRVALFKDGHSLAESCHKLWMNPIIIEGDEIS